MNSTNQCLRARLGIAITACACWILVFASAHFAFAQNITLKHTFLFGYEFSVDSIQYHPLGPDGKFLSATMGNVDEASAEMKAYKSRRAYGDFAAWTGITMIGLSLARAANGNWNYSSRNMLAIGIPLALGAIAVELDAVDHLKSAMTAYNAHLRYHRRPGILSGALRFTRGHSSVFLTLRF